MREKKNCRKTLSLLSAIYFWFIIWLKKQKKKQNKKAFFLLYFTLFHYRLGLRRWKLPLNISRKRRRKIPRPMWSSPTIWEIGIFQDDYSIGNFSLFFLLVNSLKSVLPLQQAGTPYNTIMLFKKSKTFINSCNA